MTRHTLAVGVDCTTCGLGSGHIDLRGGPNSARCDGCGRFAEKTNDYCAEHDVNVRTLPRGYSRCPYCQERDRIEAERQEMMARRANPRMHPTVDAPRF